MNKISHFPSLSTNFVNNMEEECLYLISMALLSINLNHPIYSSLVFVFDCQPKNKNRGAWEQLRLSIVTITEK